MLTQRTDKSRRWEGRHLLVSHLLGDMLYGQEEPSTISSLTSIQGELDCSYGVGEEAVSAKTPKCHHCPNKARAVSLQLHTIPTSLPKYMQLPLHEASSTWWTSTWSFRIQLQHQLLGPPSLPHALHTSLLNSEPIILYLQGFFLLIFY